MASKGPIVWLAGAPDAEAVAALCGRTSAVIPIGSATSNAYAVEIDGEASVQKAVEGLLATQCQNGFKWVAPRDLIVLPSMRRATPSEAEAVIRAISLLAWHKAHAFNGADGEPTAFAPDTLGRRRKLTTSGRSMYPRVDPVAIVLVVSSDGERILLGRQKNFPPNMFTCVSGFVEHGESVERAAARETFEETHVHVGSAELVASQPWPCGRGASCEIMLAVAARSVAQAETIDVGGAGGVSGELEAACWFDRSAAEKMLRATPGGREAWVPGGFAIAHHLVSRWVDGSLRVPS